MQVQTLVVYPRGSIAQRVLIIVSAKVFAKRVGVALCVMWDHEVAYSDLFLDNTHFITQEMLQDKKYVYYPHVDQALLYNAIEPTPNETYLIVQTTDELIHASMTKIRYIHERRRVYAHMLKYEMSGMLLGQLNLYDSPADAHCFVDDESGLNEIGALRRDDIHQGIKLLPMINKSLFYVRSHELFEYLSSIVYSRSQLLICTHKTVPQVLYNASQITLIPLLCTNAAAVLAPFDDPNRKRAPLDAVCKDVFDIPIIVNPDLNKISSLL